MSRCWTVCIDFVGDLSISWIWMPVSLPKLGKFSTMICSNMLSGPLSLLAPSGTPIKHSFFSFWGCHLFPLTFPHDLLIVFLFCPQLPSLPSTCLLCHSLIILPYLTIIRISSLDCISFNWFLILAWLDLNSAVMKSLESFMLFSRATSSFIIVLLNWLSDFKL